MNSRLFTRLPTKSSLLLVILNHLLVRAAIGLYNKWFVQSSLFICFRQNFMNGNKINQDDVFRCQINSSNAFMPLMYLGVECFVFDTKYIAIHQRKR